MCFKLPGLPPLFITLGVEIRAAGQRGAREVLGSREEARSGRSSLVNLILFFRSRCLKPQIQVTLQEWSAFPAFVPRFRKISSSRKIDSSV